MILIVGLGNPEDKYKYTRHNTGFIILDDILRDIDWRKSNKANALFYRDVVNEKEIEYLKPETFMNNSGTAVLYAATKHKIKPDHIIVIYDDIDLPLGTIKISFNRSSGGHNGVDSIIRKIKSKEFIRIRIGITPQTPAGKLKKPRSGDVEAMHKFILGNFKEEELKEIKKLSKNVALIIETIIKEGKDKAMSLYN